MEEASAAICAWVGGVDRALGPLGAQAAVVSNKTPAAAQRILTTKSSLVITRIR